jgi:hypothetical protein
MIKQVEKSDYIIPMSGSRRLHHELAWFATDDDLVLGALIRDKVDNDFSWVVLIDQGAGYACVESGTDHPTVSSAKDKLFAEIEAVRSELTKGVIPSNKFFRNGVDTTTEMTAFFDEIEKANQR